VTAVIPVVEIPLEAGRTRRRLVGQEEAAKGRRATPLISVTAVTPAVEIQHSPRSLMGVEEDKERKRGMKQKVRRSLLEEGEGEGEEKEAAGGGS
jgi:hypothetical protein